MAGRLDRHPVVQVMLGNALLLSVLYLCVGLSLEILQRYYAPSWVETATIVIDSLPARVLHEVRLLGPITAAHYEQRMSGFWMRVIFGATTISVIFILAAIVGAVMALVATLARRRK